MPLWLGWVLFFVGVLLSGIGGAIQFYYYETTGVIEKKIKNGEKLFCQFEVTDKQTKKTLFCGEKLRQANGLVYEGIIKDRFIPWYCYTTEMEVCGTECSVTFWVSGKNVKPNYEFQTILTEEGERLLRRAEHAEFIFNART